MTFCASNARQTAEKRNTSVQRAHNGGCMTTISRIKLSLKSVTGILPATGSYVPNKPEVTWYIKPNRLIRSPNLVWKRMLFKTDPNTEGIKTMPSIAALATMRHFNNAETVCDNNASRSTHTIPAITIELASHKLALNHVKPSRYD